MNKSISPILFLCAVFAVLFFFATLHVAGTIFIADRLGQLVGGR